MEILFQYYPEPQIKPDNPEHKDWRRVEEYGESR